MISTMIEDIEIIEIECYFVPLNFNSINDNFVFLIYFMSFTQSTVVLKFCTQYNQCKHNGFVVSICARKNEYIFDSVAFNDI